MSRFGVSYILHFLLTFIYLADTHVAQRGGAVAMHGAIWWLLQFQSNPHRRYYGGSPLSQRHHTRTQG